MKYAFWQCLTVILLTISCLDRSYAQLVNSFTSESPAITCQPNGAETVVTITNGNTALTNAVISIQLGVGIQLLPATVQSLSGATVQLTGPNLSAPVFTVAAWPANSTLKFSFRKKALCAARSQKISGGGFQDVISIKNGNGTALNILGTKTVTYDVIYASLSITGQNTTPVSINPGQTATRSMTISNGSFGQLEEFLFADISSAGKFTYSDFRLNPSSTNKSIPAIAITASGDSLKVKFDKALIKLIGDGDETFELNESFVLQYKITVNPCCPAGTVTSKLITQWGCEGQICQTATDNTPSVSVTSVQPNLSFSVRTSSPRCFNTPAKQTIVIANTTAYAATNVKVQFGSVNTTPNFDNTQQLYLAVLIRTVSKITAPLKMPILRSWERRPMPVHRPVLPPEWRPLFRRLRPAIPRTWSFIPFPVVHPCAMQVIPLVVGGIQEPTAGLVPPPPIPELSKQDRMKVIQPIPFPWMPRCKSTADKPLRWRSSQTAAVFLLRTTAHRRIWNTNTPSRRALYFQETTPISLS